MRPYSTKMERKKKTLLVCVSFDFRQTYRDGEWEGRTYAATIATAKQAVSNLHAVRKLGSVVNPPFPCGTVFPTLVFPLPKGVFTYPLQLPSPPRVAYAT